jgi:hypothetical protein
MGINASIPFPLELPFRCDLANDELDRRTTFNLATVEENTQYFYSLYGLLRNGLARDRQAPLEKVSLQVHGDSAAAKGGLHFETNRSIRSFSAIPLGCSTKS